MTAPALPEVFGDFLLLQRLDASPMAEVLVAVRLGERSGRTYVLKRPKLGERASGRAAQAVAREGEVLSSVKGPSVVALEAVGEIAGLPYLAVEHVRGLPLDLLLARSGALEPGAARAVALDLARALAAVHAAGWVHSDIAPSNLLVDETGETRLIDFGAAVRIGSRRAEITGKPGYVAPEAVRPIDAAGAEDVYGWGVVVAECSLGQRLFDEKDLAEAGSRAEPGRVLDDAGEDRAEIRAALARDASSRPSAADLVAALGARAIDRAALAERVAEASRSSELAAPRAAVARVAPPPSSNALTPTAPMVVRRTVPASDPPAPAEVVVSTRDVTPPAVRGSVDAPPRRVSRAALVVVAAAAAVIGLAAGRYAGRSRGGSISFPGTLPRRVEVKLDGRPVTVPIDGSPVAVTAGRHTITVQIAKTPPREYAFQVRPGEQVVLLPLLKGQGSTPADPEDRSP